jgi:uncharacterized RDD family membrane protein YckC
VGSWLGGARAGIEETGVDLGYRGERLGLPEGGPGSIAGFGRRLGALAIDWIAAWALSALVSGGRSSGFSSRSDGSYSWLTLAIFGVEVLVLTATIGGSFGQRALNVAVVTLGGRRLTVWAALIRTVLLCLVVPALIYDRDNRGLHDKAVGSVTVIGARRAAAPSA